MNPRDAKGQDKTRCVLCNAWYHRQCVEELEDVSLWTCSRCCNSISLITDLHKDIQEMKKTQEEIRKTQDKMMKVHEHTKNGQEEIKNSHDKIRKDNEEIQKNHERIHESQTALEELLRKVKANLLAEKQLRSKAEAELAAIKSRMDELFEAFTMAQQESSAKSTPRNPINQGITAQYDQSKAKEMITAVAPGSTAKSEITHPPTLLIGTSILRNVNEKKLNNCEVIAKGGATVGDINQILASNSTKKHYKEIILVAGSIEVEKESGGEIINDFKAFSVCAADKTEKIRICSILPRTDKDLMEATVSLNKDIKDMCNRDGLQFIDNDPTFFLRNGEPNSAFLTQDGLHLSQAGVESLVKNCGLAYNESPYTNMSYPKTKEKILFKGHQHPLSNFYPVNDLYVFGTRFRTSEAAYQFHKARFAGDEQTARKIQATRTGIQAMRLGSKVRTGEEWQVKKTEVMESIIFEKLKVCPEARHALTKSGSSEIIEDTSHPFWAYGSDGNGQNMMGKIWMTYRRRLKEDPSLFKEREGAAQHQPQERRWASRRYQPRCFRCGEEGHVIDQCKHQQDVRCYRCGQKAHKANRCYLYNHQYGSQRR